MQTSKKELDFDAQLIDLGDIVSAVIRGKWLIFCVSLLTFFLSFLYAINQPDVYRSQALLAPVINDTSSVSRLSGSLGGLASLAGVNIGNGYSGGRLAEAKEFLKTRTFFEKFAEQNEVLIPLMAATDWDKESNELILDESLYESEQKKFVSPQYELNVSKPSIQEAYEKFQKVLYVEEDKDTGFIRISVEHVSPFIAKKWVDDLVSTLNNTVKERDVDKAKRSIEYLEDQITKTQLTELQVGFANMIQTQIETVMLANSGDEYLFKFLDRPTVAEKNIKPRRTIICFLGWFMGVILGVFIILVRHAYLIRTK